MSFVRLAMGTVCSGPDSTERPRAGTATAAWPVAGHGNAGGAPPTGSDGAKAPCTDKVGTGRCTWTTATTTVATTSIIPTRSHRRRCALAPAVDAGSATAGWGGAPAGTSPQAPPGVEVTPGNTRSGAAVVGISGERSVTTGRSVTT